MLMALAAWWKKWRANEREHEVESAEEHRENTTDHGPGGWTPIGDLSKLSDDK